MKMRFAEKSQFPYAGLQAELLQTLHHRAAIQKRGRLYDRPSRRRSGHMRGKYMCRDGTCREEDAAT